MKFAKTFKDTFFYRTPSVAASLNFETIFLTLKLLPVETLKDNTQTQMTAFTEKPHVKVFLTIALLGISGKFTLKSIYRDISFH